MPGRVARTRLTSARISSSLLKVICRCYRARPSLSPEFGPKSVDRISAKAGVLECLTTDPSSHPNVRNFLATRERCARSRGAWGPRVREVSLRGDESYD